MSVVFHGDPDRSHHFWEYPECMQLPGNPWDTRDAGKYCRNHKYCWNFLTSGVKEYQCLGCKIEDGVLIAVLAKDKEYCLALYLRCILSLSYDKKKLHLWIRTNDNTDLTRKVLLDFVGKHGSEYASVYYDDSSVSTDLKDMGHRDWNARRFELLGNLRQESVMYAMKRNLHYFVVDCDNFIVPSTLTDLLEQRSTQVVAPMLESGGRYSNFHHPASSTGYWQQSKDYDELVSRKKSGCIPVDVVHCTYLIRNSALDKVRYVDGSSRHEYVVFSDELRKKGVQQFLLNDKFYGFLTFETDKDKLRSEVLPRWSKLDKIFGGLVLK